MRRREFLALAAAPATLTERVLGQEGATWRVGQVTVGPGAALRPLLRGHFAALGRVDGREISVIDRAAPVGGVEETVRQLAAEIDVLTVWSTIGAVGAKKAAPHVRTVFLSVGDPVRIGLVESLARPGGNMTGITFEAAMEAYGKRLQILKVIVPGLKRIAVLRTAGDANVPPAMEALSDGSKRLDVSLLPFDFSAASDLAAVFSSMKYAGAEAVIVISGALTFENGTRIAALALENRLPSSHGFRETVVDGGLVSIGPDFAEMARQAAVMIRKIIGGTKPADIPVEQPTKYTLAINLVTARALDVTVPSGLVASADEVIE